MKTLTPARATALLLAAVLGGAVAQTAPAPTPKVLSDAQPLPAEDRASMGAVMLQEEPVIAQRELVQQTVARNRELMSTVMGAGSAQLPPVVDGKGSPKKLDRARDKVPVK